MKCNNPFAFRPAPVSFWTTLVYLIIAVPLLFVHETVPPAPSDHSLYRGINLTEAWHDLEFMTSAYHPFNSRQNDVVRSFLLARSREILERNDIKYTTDQAGGVAWDAMASDEDGTNESDELVATSKPMGATLFDDETSNVTWTYDTSRRIGTKIGPSSYAGTYFEGNNFYVYIHGSEDPEGEWWKTQSEYKQAHGKGGVLINCHFDSVSTGFGATDDGVACVSMLQLMSYFTSDGRQPKHGMVLMFNNAEEDGLYGATAFGKSPLLQFCHTFMNLEGAGAGGRAILFRTTDLQAAQAYRKSPHPFGTVVGADAFKRGVIRSGTDYTVFHDKFGMRGMDIAFYSPRARYHTEEDDARHTSVDSIWHMLSAALASAESLSKTTGTVFNGPRSDGDKSLPQNGKPTEGVWFDLFGSGWATFALRGLFAWSLALLVATPLVVFLVMYLLIRQDKFYFFSKDIWVHSELDDDPVVLGGWKGLFRFPLTMIFAGALTIASTFLIGKVNPLIVYSSSYALWAMTISLFYFTLWLGMRGSSVVRPSALQRGYVNLWLFVLGWVVQVFAAVAEDRMHLSVLYPTVFLQTAVFLSLVVSLLEMFALPSKQDFARGLHDEHHERDIAGHDGADSPTGGNDHDTDEPSEPTERTPLRTGDGSGSRITFAENYRRSMAREATALANARKYQPFPYEQSWSGRLPTWPWIVQFLLLAPVPLMLFGNLALVFSSALSMTGTDGSSLLLPLVLPSIMTIILLLPLTPFIHRVTHHVPTFLLLVFIGTFIYNLAAFPFSVNHRFKFFFQQVVDLDKNTDYTTITGLEDYIRPVIASLPSVAGREPVCKEYKPRDLTACRYESSSLTPHLVNNRTVDELISVSTSQSSDGLTANLLVDALETRMCYLEFSKPIYGFSVEGGSDRDPRFGTLPEEGFKNIQLWRRDWDGAWNVTVQLTGHGRKSSDSEAGPSPIDSAFDYQEELKRAAFFDGDESKEELMVLVRCAWSDANQPSTIPAIHELERYMPAWATLSKGNVGLVEVWKRFGVTSAKESD